MTESKLKESDEVLKRYKKIHPQYEIDGKRNIWIVKPGDKSKGIGKQIFMYISPHTVDWMMTLSCTCILLVWLIGIEFVCKMDDIIKYISNTTLAGTYVIQKYIGKNFNIILNIKKVFSFVLFFWRTENIFFVLRCWFL